MRYYFDTRDRIPIRDPRGRDFPLPQQAIAHAEDLAADFRAMESEVRPNLRIRVIAETGDLMHEEMVYGQTA